MPGKRQAPTGNDRPLRADAERNRRRILEAAHEVFGERGLRATLDEVAAHAGVGVGTVYRRFPDREALIRAVFEPRVQELIAMAERGEQNPDPWEGLLGILREGAEFHGRNRAVRELAFSPPGERGWVDRARDIVRPKVARVVARAQKQGKVRADMATLDVPMIHLMLAEILAVTADVNPYVWERLLTFVVDGLVVSRDEPTPIEVGPLMVPEA